MGKAKRKPSGAVLSDRDEMIEEFRAFREAHGLPFDPALVPHRFDGPKDLELAYWQAEDAVKVSREVPPPPSSAPAQSYSQKQVDRKFALMLEVLGRWVGERIAEALKASVEPMRQRIMELENREYGGAWRPGRTYAKSSIVSHAGSGWIALVADPTGRPGTEGSGWKLFVKAGRDAKSERTRP